MSPSIRISLAIVALLAMVIYGARHLPAEAQTRVPTAIPRAPVQAKATAIPAHGWRVFRLVSEQSEATYQVQEKFLERALPITAIGRTNQLAGAFEFSLAGQPTARVITMTVDLRTLRSEAEP